MQRYEYKIVPAPAKGTKARGVKTPEGRFAHTLESLLNELAAEGWEFQRAELLPSEERSGLTGSVTNWRNVLVFRRALETPASVEEAPAVPVVAPVGAVPQEPDLPDATGDTPPEPPLHASEDPAAQGAGDENTAHPIPGPGAVEMIKDDGVEELSPVSGVTAALKARAAQQQDHDGDEGTDGGSKTS